MMDRPPLEPVDTTGEVAVPTVAAASAISLCPFLSSVDGDWRAAAAAREHRCAAVTPAAALTLDKQRRLCLVAAHVSCTTYRAARRDLVDDEGGSGQASGQTAAGSAPDDRRIPGPSAVTRWAIPRTAPVVLDRGRPSLAALMAHRSVTQLALVLLMALAFLVLALARLSADDRRSSVPVTPSPAMGASPARSPDATVLASGTAPASVVVTPAASAPAVSGSPAVSPPGSPAASSSARTYRVVAGDTLTAIAARYHVTVKALQEANDIADPSRLRIGMVLIVP